MNFTEYRVIDESYEHLFIEKLNTATEDGFKVISSNNFVLKHENYNDNTCHYETSYYALMIRNQVQTSSNSNNFQYSVLDELKKIKFELREIVENLKYSGE